MHWYQYTQKIEHCSNKFDFLPLFCLEGLVPNSVLSGSRGNSPSVGRGLLEAEGVRFASKLGFSLVANRNPLLVHKVLAALLLGGLRLY